MTRKTQMLDDLAKALKIAQPELDTGDFIGSIQKRYGWFKAVSAVVSVAEANHPRFNRKKFYEACGINTDNYKGS